MKYLDKKIEYVFENANVENHRSLIVIIGENGKNQLPVLHNALIKKLQTAVSSIVWCHKNEITRSTGKQISNSKKQKRDKTLENEDDPLTLFMKLNNIEFIEYKESEKILGQTVDMLILQDFEALSPNLIATSMEIVKGGGLILLLLDKVSTIDALIAKKTDIHNLIDEEAKITPRYNRRLFKMLINSEFTLFLDDKLRVLDITKLKIKEIRKKEKNIEVIDDQIVVETPEDILKNLSKTEEQLNTVKEIFTVLNNRTERSICSLTAARGRGKSVAMGISAARAINLGYSTVYIASPALENVKMVFQFLIEGLEKIGYKKYIDFKIIYHFKGNKRLVQKIEITKTQRHVIEYISPYEPLKYHPDLLIIDEAAAIPLIYLKKLLFPNIILLSTTMSGYEGTGRAYAIKMMDYLEKSSNDSNPFNFIKLDMNESIRYAKHDPVERWLQKTLLLETTVPKINSCPDPKSCRLMHVNRNVLFSSKSASEAFLIDLFSLFAASHYKNSPNDLQILADSPSHEVFALITPVDDNGVDIPRVICAIQVSFEGRCKKIGYSKEGNLIPWVISEDHLDTSFLEEYGARIVRIAVHPDYISMGYGSTALNMLIKKMESETSQISYLSFNAENGGNVLLNELNEISIPKIEWIGVSFGITDNLFKFWYKSGFLPVSIKQQPSPTTGEHTAIFLRKTETYDALTINKYNMNFKVRFVGQLAHSFTKFSPSLCLSLIHSSDQMSTETPLIYFSENDVKRIKKFAENIIDFRQVNDLVPDIARMYFYGKLSGEVSLLRRSVLVMVGCQHMAIEDVSEALTLQPYQVLNILSKVFATFVDEIIEKYSYSKINIK